MLQFIKIVKFIVSYPPNKGQRIHRLKLFLFWQTFKRIIKKPIVHHLDNYTRYLAYPHSEGASFPFYTSVYDYLNVEFLRKNFSGQGMMIDVGANIGLFTLSLIKKFQMALVFEPDKESCRMLRENIALNRLSDQIVVYEAAAGDKDGIASFENSAKAGLANKVSINGGIKVRQVCIDTILFNEMGKKCPKVEFVKIDVEGYELNVLLGMEKLVKGTQPPRIIQFERLQNTPLDPLRDWFENKGWTIFMINENGSPSTSESDIVRAHDLMATSENVDSFKY
jgi:FkbM family methyltransferase